MDLGITGKKALVTGGTHGIGQATALLLAQEGCSVAVCSRTKNRIDETLQKLERYSVQTLGIQADLTNEQNIQNVFKTMIQEWGTIHILINNVGGGGRWGREIVEETEEKVWLEVYNKNALTAIRCTNLALPYMRKQKWGRVVTVTSIFGREAGGNPWFSMAKSAQTALMKSLAKKRYLSRENITFNSVAPGAIMIPDTGWSALAKENPGEMKKFIDEHLPSNRFGTPEEVAQVIAFLCSEKASLINGASIPVDGGQGNSNL